MKPTETDQFNVKHTRQDRALRIRRQNAHGRRPDRCYPWETLWHYHNPDTYKATGRPEATTSYVNRDNPPAFALCAQEGF